VAKMCRHSNSGIRRKSQTFHAPGRGDPGAFADRQVAPDAGYLLVLAGSGTRGVAMGRVLTHSGKEPLPRKPAMHSRASALAPLRAASPFRFHC
jgi:hypothetical protein